MSSHFVIGGQQFKINHQDRQGRGNDVSYKNSIRESSTVEMMICHVNHIYAALGCVIQDIQFMVGNMMKIQEEKVKKERTSLPGHLQSLSFAHPKIQFLPSSSYKYDNYEPVIEQPRKQINKSSAMSSNNSFDEMFPQMKNQNKLPSPRPKKNTEKPVSKNSHPPPADSQEDFMDYLFNKRKS